jgi:hypothetical protein
MMKQDPNSFAANEEALSVALLHKQQPWLVDL